MFDGSDIDAAFELQSSGWADSRGGMFFGGQLFHADDNGVLWMSQFTDDEFEVRAAVNLFGLTENEWVLSQLGGMFFDFELSRVYCMIEGDSLLHYRAFSPYGTFFGDVESFAAEQGDIPWTDVNAMDVINGYLYFVRNDGTLYRSDIDGTDVVTGTTETISGPFIDGRTWDGSILAFLGEGEIIGGGDVAPLEFESSGDSAGT